MGLAEVACIALHEAILIAAWEFAGGCMRWRTESPGKHLVQTGTGEMD